MDDLEQTKELFDRYAESLRESDSCSNFCVYRQSTTINELKLSTEDRLKIDALGLNEFKLEKLNGKPINENKNASWELILGAYCVALEGDPKWHFFYEDSYNIIRCSIEYEENLKNYLDDCGVSYRESGIWMDGQAATWKYQHIFCPMFHSFTLMAVLGDYKNYEIYGIFDRVYHCFLNHQFLNLSYSYGKELDYMWEAHILANAAVSRASYAAHLSSNVHYENEKEKEYKERWLLEKYLEKIRKWTKRKIKRNISPA